MVFPLALVDFFHHGTSYLNLWLRGRPAQRMHDLPIPDLLLGNNQTCGDFLAPFVLIQRLTTPKQSPSKIPQRLLHWATIFLEKTESRICLGMAPPIPHSG